MSEITAALNGPEADAMADADRDALTTELISEGSRYPRCAGSRTGGG